MTEARLFESGQVHVRPIFWPRTKVDVNPAALPAGRPFGPLQMNRQKRYD